MFKAIANKKLLLLNFLLWSCLSLQAAPHPAPSSQQEMLKLMNMHQLQLQQSIQESIQKYQEDREQILVTYKQWFPKNYGYWLRKLDSHFYKNYFLHITKILRKSNLGYAASYADHLQQSIDDYGNQNFKWRDDLIYSQYGRGSYNSNDSVTHLQISSPSEVIGPLIHEITHALDKELHIIRYQPETLKQQDPLAYEFYKQLYLPFYKELLPRLNACQVYVDLRNNQHIDGSPQDDKSYLEVLKGNKTCFQWTYDSFFPHPKLNYSWLPGSPQREALEQYELKWLQERGFSRSFHRK